MRLLRKIVLTLMAMAVGLAFITFLFMQQASFGKLPSGKRLDRIKQSSNYKDGSFGNLEETAMMAEGTSYPRLMYHFLFTPVVRREPGGTLPSIRTDLKTLSDAPTLVWFGHSTYLISIHGLNILVDPVFSERASPVQYLGSKQYAYSHQYDVDDLPSLDLVIISHDHYDHLDYHTILKLKSKTKLFCTGLGVGSHLAHWGIDESRIREFDWWEGDTVLPGLKLTATPARHFSGRGFTRFQTLWSSFVLETAGKKIFVGGDSGYDASFRKIGEKFGPFDIVMLECGQYNSQWPNIHMTPEQTVQASIDLNSKALMPVHWGKFSLSLHPWNEPPDRALRASDSLGVTMITPTMGAPLYLDTLTAGNRWWLGIP